MEYRIVEAKIDENSTYYAVQYKRFGFWRYVKDPDGRGIRLFISFNTALTLIKEVLKTKDLEDTVKFKKSKVKHYIYED